MSIKMVRQPSETPNITNIDDIIPFRYAYGNQNGYVKDKGNEIGYVVNGSQFTIQSGRLVLQGVEADISASGVTIEIDSVNETRYYALYLQVNLALNTVSIQSQYDTMDYPTISSGDDLTENSSGIANLVLYHFTANNGVISNIAKIIQEIDYINKNVTVNNAQNVQNVDFSNNTVATFGDYIVSKKRLIFDGNKSVSFGTTSGNDITVTDSVADGDVIEVIFDITINVNITFPVIGKVVLYNNSFNYGSEIVIGGTKRFAEDNKSAGELYINFKNISSDKIRCYFSNLSYVNSSSPAVVSSLPWTATIKKIYKIIG